ncbi:hypothetical protein GPECTOR_7g956 [Gonium pectorale]|uniref:Ankyrin repeat domain-containing protein n=1 Tax=Gonium pectorale TaxID=33097 RepID=A0A150GUF5_GONPE|nr:hypothetical protein GPECTOR_7g956 [Gonium pectorale]|eukprot:KXZ53506.1 hypothetical protein GPECTOR_7g956 [Gonium pectorale]
MHSLCKFSGMAPNAQCVSALAAAGFSGDQGLCEWLLAEGCPWDQAAVLAAACAGHVGLVKWFLTLWPELLSDFGFASGLVKAAAMGCPLAELQRLLSDWVRRGLPTHLAAWGVSGAASSHAPDWRAKVEWLEGLTNIRLYNSCDLAAACPGYGLERVRYLRQRGYVASSWTLYAAARAGNAELVEELLAAGVAADDVTAWHAAEGGSVPVLRALAAAGHPLSPVLLGNAASRGHLPAVAFMVEELGLEPSYTAAHFAAMAGCLQSVLYLLQTGRSTPPFIPIDVIAEGGNCALLEMLAAHWHTIPQAFIGNVFYGGTAYLRAGRHGDMATLRCLWRLGCPWPPFHHAVHLPFHLQFGIDPVPAGCPLDVLDWMLAGGCPVDWDAAVEAALRRPDDGAEVAQWLLEQWIRHQLL